MKQRRQLWFSVHSWIGLKLSILTGFVILTGTLSVFSWELDWAANAEMRVAPQAEPNRVSWGELYNAARTAHPESRVFVLTRHDDPWFATQVEMVAPWGERFRLWINPYSGEIQGITPWLNIHRFLLQLHSRLMLPSNVGTLLVTPLAFLILASLVTGLVAYKKFWRGFFRKPRFGASPRAWLGDLHRLAGVLSIWFLIIVGTTGAYFLIDKIGLGASGIPRGGRSMERSFVLPKDFSGTKVNQAVSIARKEISDLQVRTIAFPQGPGGIISVQGHATAKFVGSRTNAVFIDPSTLDTLGTLRGEDLSPYQRAAELSFMLHFGTWGGLVSRVVWLIFGLVLFSIAVMGAAIYGQRAARTLRADRNKAD